MLQVVSCVLMWERGDEIVNFAKPQFHWSVNQQWCGLEWLWVLGTSSIMFNNVKKTYSLYFFMNSLCHICLIRKRCTINCMANWSCRL
jgi:hypothetical protein